MTTPGPVECAGVLAQIEAYVDGELDAVECGAIEHHCEGCVSCADIVRGLRQTIGLCREAGRMPLPHAISARAREQVKRLLAESRIPPER